MTEYATVARPGEGRVFSLGGDVARVLVPSGAADFSVFESTVGVRGVPLHRHHRADEAFYLLEGVLDVVVGDRAERCAAGTFVFVPRGTPHRFANPGPAAVQMLVMGSPRVQALVEATAPLVAQSPPDPAAVAATFARFDSELLLPGT